MAGEFRRYIPGELPKLSASFLNRLADMAERDRAETSFSQQETISRIESECWVLNVLALPLGQFYVTGVEDKPLTMPSKSLPGYKKRKAYRAKAPQPAATFAILQEPARPGVAAEAQLSGETKVRVLLNRLTDGFADASSEYEYLSSQATAAPAMLIAKCIPDDTELTDAIDDAVTELEVLAPKGWGVLDAAQPGNLLQLIALIDEEEVLVTLIEGKIWTVTRGQNGTAPAAHDAEAVVSFKSGVVWADVELVQARGRGADVQGRDLVLWANCDTSDPGVVRVITNVRLPAVVERPDIGPGAYEALFGETFVTKYAYTYFATWKSDGSNSDTFSNVDAERTPTSCVVRTASHTNPEIGFEIHVHGLVGTGDDDTPTIPARYYCLEKDAVQGCYLVTPDELLVLVAKEGWSIVTGPHDTSDACDADCTPAGSAVCPDTSAIDRVSLCYAIGPGGNCTGIDRHQILLYSRDFPTPGDPWVYVNPGISTCAPRSAAISCVAGVFVLAIVLDAGNVGEDVVVTKLYTFDGGLASEMVFARVGPQTDEYGMTNWPATMTVKTGDQTCTYPPPFGVGNLNLRISGCDTCGPTPPQNLDLVLAWAYPGFGDSCYRDEGWYSIRVGCDGVFLDAMIVYMGGGDPGTWRLILCCDGVTIVDQTGTPTSIDPFIWGLSISGVPANPCGCDNLTISVGGTVATACCPDVLLPAVVHITVEGLNCTVADEELTYVVGHAWHSDGYYGSVACAGKTLWIAVACGGSSPSGFMLYLECNDGEDPIPITGEFLGANFDGGSCELDSFVLTMTDNAGGLGGTDCYTAPGLISATVTV